MKQYSKLLLASFLTILACLGFGRFAFGMVLPNIQTDLNISTTLVGFIGTANFIGYLVGILFASSLYSKINTSKLLFISLLFQGLSMLIMSMSYDYIIIASLYTITGFFGALANISIMVYISHVIPKNIRGKALGFAVSGNGIAIIVSGMIVPYFETIYNAYSWRISWSFFALIIVGISFFIKSSLKSDSVKHTSNSSKTYELFYNSSFWKIASLYLIFGITYVVYMTFFVSAAINKWELSVYSSGIFWSSLGFICIFSGPIFGALADKIGAFKTLILVFSLQFLANFILIFSVPKDFLWISIFAFGISVWSIPSLVTLLCSQYFGLAKTAQVFSLVTLIFALGQITAPIGAGYIFDVYQSYDKVFLLTSLLLFIAILLSIFYSRKNSNLIKLDI